MFLTAISALNVIFAAIAQGLTDGVIHLSGSDLSGLKDDFDFLSVGCIHVGVRAGSILSCFVVATIHSRVRILQATSLIGLLGRGAILLTLPITGFTKASAHVLACIIGACQSVVEIVSRIVIYLFNAFSSLGQLLAATIVHVQQPDERSLLYVAGGTTIVVAVVFCVVLILSPASTPAPLTASKCRVILTGIGVFSSTALTSFALRNIPYLLEATGKPVDEATGQHLVGLFYIAFTISRFVTILLSFRVSSSSLWFYSSLLIIPSILLLNSDTHCGATKIAVVIFGCFVGPLYPSSISSLTTSGPLSFLILALLVLITQIAESVNLFKTNSVQAVLMGLNLLCLGSAALNRLGTSCTWKPDMGIKTVP